MGDSCPPPPVLTLICGHNIYTYIYNMVHFGSHLHRRKAYTNSYEDLDPGRLREKDLEPLSWEDRPVSKCNCVEWLKAVLSVFSL